MRIGRLLTFALLLALPVLASACVEERRPATCDDPEITIQLSVTAKAMTPNNPGVCRDQSVTLRIASEVDGFFHIHGYDHAVPASPIAAGEELVLEFVADRSGQFPVEIHPADDPQGIDVGILTVHEP